METLNFLFCLAIFGQSSWAILHPNFKDGIVMKFGLILLAMASFVTALSIGSGKYHVQPHEFVINFAITVVLLSMLWRRLHRMVWSHRS